MCEHGRADAGFHIGGHRSACEVGQSGVHEHDGSHGHGHEQRGFETLIDETGCRLRLIEHEGQLVASYQVDLDCDMTCAREWLRTFASGLADAVYARDGIVGHIKAFAREQGASIRLSVTLHDPDIVSFDNVQVHVEGVAIVYGVDRAWYERECTTRITALWRCS